MYNYKLKIFSNDQHIFMWALKTKLLSFFTEWFTCSFFSLVNVLVSFPSLKWSTWDDPFIRRKDLFLAHCFRGSSPWSVDLVFSQEDWRLLTSWPENKKKRGKGLRFHCPLPGYSFSRLKMSNWAPSLKNSTISQ